MSRRLTIPLEGSRAPSEQAAVTAVIALGSNLGDRAATLSDAADEIRALPLVEDVRLSTPLETVAVTLDGPDADKPAYLNAVALVRTRLAPSVLLTYLQRIESAHGRERRERWGDRTLDLDLVTYGEVGSDDPALTLPHPRAHEREFVLAPWLSLDPDAEIPGRGRVSELLDGLRRP